MQYLLLFLGITLFPIVPQLADAWELEKNEQGVKVYTRYVDYSSFKEFKVEIDINTTAKEVADLLNDGEGIIEWVYGCGASDVVKQVSDTEYYLYAIFDAPFPITDRDIVYHLQTEPIANGYVVKQTGVADFVENKKGKIRAEKAYGEWTITQNGNMTKVSYRHHIEPGGYLPAWLANLKVVEAPFNTMINMRNRLEQRGVTK